ncbi:hypothetical protein ACSBR2_005650 [Camellia fascicularis]
MASIVVTAEQPTATEVFPWLKTLPLASKYHPTLSEFQDPIAYIFKIEKEAFQYGICNIVPPVLALSKKTVIVNLNRSLAVRSTIPSPNLAPIFTTRQQQIRFYPQKHRSVQKPLWQSGENYTLPQFEAKAKTFETCYLKKILKKVRIHVKTLYWKARGSGTWLEMANVRVELGGREGGREGGRGVLVI